MRWSGKADALIEGFRPGVMERLGLGPDVALARNPKLVYGRMTGWGQDGPLAPRAGHDINYIALAGRAARFRPHGRGAGAAAQPRRRLRRRRHAARLRHRLRAARGRPLRKGPGGRCRDGRRRVAARGDVLRVPRGQELVGRARREHSRYRARRGTTSTRPGTASTSRSARSRRSSIGELLAAAEARGRDSAGPVRTRTLARDARAFRRTFKSQDPRRVVPGVRRLGCLLRPGALVLGIEAPSAQRRARQPRRGGRRGPARPGAAVFAHPGRGAASAARSAARAASQRSPTGASARPRWNG